MTKQRSTQATIVILWVLNRCGGNIAHDYRFSLEPTMVRAARTDRDFVLMLTVTDLEQQAPVFINPAIFLLREEKVRNWEATALRLESRTEGQAIYQIKFDLRPPKEGWFHLELNYARLPAHRIDKDFTWFKIQTDDSIALLSHAASLIFSVQQGSLFVLTVTISDEGERDWGDQGFRLQSPTGEPQISRRVDASKQELAIVFSAPMMQAEFEYFLAFIGTQPAVSIDPNNRAITLRVIADLSAPTVSIDRSQTVYSNGRQPIEATVIFADQGSGFTDPLPVKGLNLQTEDQYKLPSTDVLGQNDQSSERGWQIVATIRFTPVQGGHASRLVYELGLDTTGAVPTDRAGHPLRVVKTAHKVTVIIDKQPPSLQIQKEAITAEAGKKMTVVARILEESSGVNDWQGLAAQQWVFVSPSGLRLPVEALVLLRTDPSQAVIAMTVTAPKQDGIYLLALKWDPAKPDATILTDQAGNGLKIKAESLLVRVDSQPPALVMAVNTFRQGETNFLVATISDSASKIEPRSIALTDFQLVNDQGTAVNFASLRFLSQQTPFPKFSSSSSGENLIIALELDQTTPSGSYNLQVQGAVEDKSGQALQGNVQAITIETGAIVSNLTPAVQLFARAGQNSASLNFVLELRSQSAISADSVRQAQFALFSPVDEETIPLTVQDSEVLQDAPILKVSLAGEVRHTLARQYQLLVQTGVVQTTGELKGQWQGGHQLVSLIPHPLTTSEAVSAIIVVEDGIWVLGQDHNRLFRYKIRELGIHVTSQALPVNRDPAEDNYRVSEADIDGDGKRDRLILIPSADGGSRIQIESGDSKQVGSLGYNHDRAITRVVGLGDLNDDGRDDFGVLLADHALIIYGGAFDQQLLTTTFSLSDAQALFRLSDLNGDRFDELAYTIATGRSQSLIVVTGFDSTSGSSPIQNRQEVTITDLPNIAAIATGDLDGDGRSDILIGSNQAVTVVWGQELLSFDRQSMNQLPAEAMTTISDSGGLAVAILGDINGDGHPAFGFQRYRTDQIPEVVIHYRASSKSAQFSLRAKTPDDRHFGSLIASPGDLNQDGYADILIASGPSRWMLVFGSAVGLDYLDQIDGTRDQSFLITDL